MSVDGNKYIVLGKFNDFVYVTANNGRPDCNSVFSAIVRLWLYSLVW